METMRKPSSIHYWLTKFAVKLGGNNPLVLLTTRRRCARFGVNVARTAGALELRRDSNAIRIAAHHFAYAPSIAEKFDYYFNMVEATPRADVRVVDYSGPKLQTCMVSKLQLEMASFPEEESLVDSYFRLHTPVAGDLIYDVGAHCGLSTYHFSHLVGPSGKVVAFEPDSLNYSLLLRNIERHGLSNVTPVKAAIGGRRGKAAFNSEGTIGSGLSHIFDRASLGGVEMVDVLTLDDAFDAWGVPDFCKIDIEGAEIEALAASTSRLASERIPIALDTCHIVNGIRTEGEVVRLLRSCGYRTESAEIDGFMNTWAVPL